MKSDNKEIVLPYDESILERAQRMSEFLRLTPEQRAAKAEWLARWDKAEAALGLTPPLPADNGMVDPDWSFPATMREWARRFHKSERTLHRWRKKTMLLMKRFGKEWRVEVHCPLYQTWEKARYNSK